MSNDVRNEGPLRHFRIGRRDVLQSLVTGAGVAAFAAPAVAHVHPVAAAATRPDATPATDAGASTRVFLDEHAFDTLAALAEQIVPGSRATQVPEFLDRLIAVESTDTQKRFMQALGAFERAAREAHGKPWKSLSAEEASALLTKISTQPSTDPARSAFDAIKGAVAETYFSSEAGKLELGWDRSVTFTPPSACA